VFKLVGIDMKRVLKLLITSVFYYCGIVLLAKLLSSLSGKRLTILTFHRITNPDRASIGLPSICLSRENFDSLLKFVLKHYTVISLEQYLTFAQNGRAARRRNYLILSFDDGYREMKEVALPTLRKYDLPAVLFVPSDAIDSGGYFWWDAAYELLSNSNSDSLALQQLREQSESPVIASLEKSCRLLPVERKQAIFDFFETLQNASPDVRQQYVDFLTRAYERFRVNHSLPPIPSVLDWKEVDELQRSGITIGSHTKSHQFLSTISGEAASVELVESKRIIKDRVGATVTALSYPGGKYSEETLKLAKEAGYACAVTTDSGLNSFKDDPFKLKRINIWDNKVSGRDGGFSKALVAWHLFLIN
jgi:peptidoglycan/xylan/chitin deacetylase (PgdA/CDA1 family)